MQSSKLPAIAVRWLAVVTLAWSLPALAGKADYTKENVASPSCNKRC